MTSLPFYDLKLPQWKRKSQAPMINIKRIQGKDDAKKRSPCNESEEAYHFTS